MHEFNWPQDWYKYISGRVISEFNELCPEQSSQVMREFLVVLEFIYASWTQPDVNKVSK